MYRQPAVAGIFYPDEPAALREAVARMLAEQDQQPPQGRIKALIAPHAGYIYSGALAGQAYAQLAAQAGEIRRVILLGPVHRVPVRGLALPDSNGFTTPIGEIPVDGDAVMALSRLPQVVNSAAAHAQEHSLEVHLPFLQAILGDFTLVPLAVGDATPEEVEQVLETLWGGNETLIVVSSDLSHYLPYAEAGARDRDTVARILRGDLLSSHKQACGATPINGLLLAARRHGLSPRLIAQCNSGDTAGERDHVVGYAAIEFLEGEAETSRTDDDERGRILLNLARSSIASALGQPQSAEASHDWLQEEGACFVTLTQNGQLRGCIGSIEPHRSLRDDVIANARAAALGDPRFAPLSREELDITCIEVSLLSPLEPIRFQSEDDALAQLRPGVDGLVLEYGPHRSTFLPQVWESLPGPRDFLGQLKRKAGLRADFWSEDIRLQRYHVTKWSEPEDRRSVQ